MAKNIRFAEIAESFLTWNEGKTRIAQCVMMGNISHSETINKFQKKSKGSLTQINAASVLQYQEREKRQHDRISTLLNVHLNKDVKYQGAYNRNNQRRE